MIETQSQPKTRDLIRRSFREARRALRFTQNEIASHAGIGISALSQFEKGDIGLRGEVIDLVADKLNEQYRALQREAIEIVERGEGLPIRLLAFGFNDKATREDTYDFTDKVALEIVTRGKTQQPEQAVPTGRLTQEQADRIRFRAAEIMEQWRAERKARAAEIRRKRWIARLEKLQSKVHDPVITEIIKSFRREIRSLEEQLASKKPVPAPVEESED